MSDTIKEAESLVAHIRRAYQITKVDIDVTGQALDCCRRIRENAAGAKTAKYELDALIVRLRTRADVVRMYAPLKNLDERAHSKATKRREAYWLEHDRGFSHPKACERAAAKLGVSPKTIVRALKGH